MGSIFGPIQDVGLGPPLTWEWNWWRRNPLFQPVLKDGLAVMRWWRRRNLNSPFGGSRGVGLIDLQHNQNRDNRSHEILHIHFERKMWVATSIWTGLSWQKTKWVGKTAISWRGRGFLPAFKYFSMRLPVPVKCSMMPKDSGILLQLKQGLG